VASNLEAVSYIYDILSFCSGTVEAFIFQYVVPHHWVIGA